jgi:hypothetical protein
MLSLQDALRSLDLKEELNIETVNDKRNKYKRTLTKSVITFALISISIIEGKEEVEEKVICMILNYLKSFYEDVENGKYTELHWENLKKSLTGKKHGNSTDRNLNGPSRKLAMCWNIVSFLLEDKRLNLVPNHADLHDYNILMFTATKKILFSSNNNNHYLAHHEMTTS